MRAGLLGVMALCISLGSGCDAWESNIYYETDGEETDGGTDTEAESSTSGAASGGGSKGTSSTGGEETTGDEPDSTTSSTSSSGTSGTTSSDPSGDDSGPPPLGPGCSVQVVTQGAMFDPLSRGGAGEFPAEVADVLEDFCGCHTLMNGGQNIEWASLPAPGGTLFLDYADMNRSYGGSTLGAAIQAEVTGYAMPPGSCSWPSTPSGILSNWMSQGMPDGANYVP